MKKLRAYEYRCLRCGEVFDENIGFESELVEEHIRLISVPDEQEEQRLTDTYDSYLGNIQLKSFHDCEDNGIGLGELIGGSAEYDQIDTNGIKKSK